VRLSTIPRVAALIGWAIAGTSGTTVAAEASPPATVRAHLEIVAAADCATFAAIAARVGERSTRIRFVDALTEVPALRGRIGPSKGAGVFAELTVVQPTGRQSRRHLTARTCEEATDALALLIAMTLDPAAALRAVPEPANDASKLEPRAATTESSTNAAAHASPTPSSTGPTSGQTPSSSVTTPVGRNNVAAPAEVNAAAERPASATSEAVPTPTVRSGSLGILGAGTTGPVPGTLLGLGVYGFVAFDGVSPVSLALRATAAHHWRSGVSAAGGVADFALDVAALDLCALRLSLGPVTSRACVAGRLGRLSASGSATYDAQSHGRWFASAGGAALVTAALPGAFEIAAEAELGWSLTRDEFAFNPQVFYRTQPLTRTLGLGIGRHF